MGMNIQGKAYNLALCDLKHLRLCPSDKGPPVGGRPLEATLLNGSGVTYLVLGNYVSGHCSCLPTLTDLLTVGLH